jgi:hypothetical protein
VTPRVRANEHNTSSHAVSVKLRISFGRVFKTGLAGMAFAGGFDSLPRFSSPIERRGGWTRVVAERTADGRTGFMRSEERE